jgi:formate hydrogenlyase subunit 4
MSILTGLLTQLLHLALILALAPVLTGCVRWLKARLMGRRGPHPLQAWRDVLKLLKKRPVLAENASAISRAAPYMALAAAVLAAALVPSFARGMVLAPFADLLLMKSLSVFGSTTCDKAPRTSSRVMLITSPDR